MWYTRSCYAGVRNSAVLHRHVPKLGKEIGLAPRPQQWCRHLFYHLHSPPRYWPADGCSDRHSSLFISGVSFTPFPCLYGTRHCGITATASSFTRQGARRAGGVGSLLTCIRCISLSPAGTSSTASSEVPFSSVFSTYCVLCDTPFTNWVAHTELPSHAARVAISVAFVKPERSESMLSQLKEHINVDCSVIEEATEVKVQRRKRRLRSSLQYLVQEGVLHHCIPTLTSTATSATSSPSDPNNKNSNSNSNGEPNSSPDAEPATPLGSSSCLASSSSWDIRNSDAFLNHVLVGQAYVEEALTDRVARLAPRTSGSEIYFIVRYLSEARQWSKLFDMLQLSTVFCVVEKEECHAGASSPGTSSTCPRPTVASGTPSLSSSCTNSSSSSSSSPVTNTSRGVPSRSIRLTQSEKAMLIWSCMGELRVLEERDRSYKVENKAITDQLVHHVLISHCLDNILSELLHHTLEKVVEECTPVWRVFQKQEGYMRLRAYQSRPSDLSPFPMPRKSLETKSPGTPQDHRNTEIKREKEEQKKHEMEERESHDGASEEESSEEDDKARGKENQEHENSPSTLLHSSFVDNMSRREAELLALFFSPWKEYTSVQRGHDEDNTNNMVEGSAPQSAAEDCTTTPSDDQTCSTEEQWKREEDTKGQRQEVSEVEKKNKKNSTSSSSSSFPSFSSFPTEKNSSLPRAAAGNSTSTRWLWQDVSRQLLYERPIVPPETPTGSFAPFYPRLQPASPLFPSGKKSY